MASARAIATRCCCPPDSCAGYASALSARPTRARLWVAIRCASARERRSTRRCAIHRGIHGTELSDDMEGLAGNRFLW
jgi:hypothetical protein